MIEEFNLSESIKINYNQGVIPVGRVKEFIRLLATLGLTESQWNKLREWAGEKLL